MVLALGATPISVWATSPTLRVLTPATNIDVASLCHLWLVAAVAVKDLRVELPFAISGHVDQLDPTCGCHQVTAVVAVAIAFALGATFSPSHANERVELLTHHGLQHHANTSSGQFAQILLERLLLRQGWDALRRR